MSASLKQTLVQYKQYHQKDLSLPPRNSKLKFYPTYSPASLSQQVRMVNRNEKGALEPKGLPSGLKNYVSARGTGFQKQVTL